MPGRQSRNRRNRKEPRMDTRHLVDPEVLPMVDVMPSFVFDRETLDQVRADSAGRFANLVEIPLAPTIRTASAPTALPTKPTSSGW